MRVFRFGLGIRNAGHRPQDGHRVGPRASGSHGSQERQSDATELVEQRSARCRQLRFTSRKLGPCEHRVILAVQAGSRNSAQRRGHSRQPSLPAFDNAHVSTERLAEYEVRAPSPDELDAVADVLVADDLDDAGEIVLDADFRRSDWSRPGFDLAANAWVFVDGGRSPPTAGHARRPNIVDSWESFAPSTAGGGRLRC
jgi:hypothetical protein